MKKLTIRPSSVDTFTQCSYQWYRVFIKQESGIPNARAAIGTAIHAGAEHAWNKSIKAKKKVIEVPDMIDAAVAAFKEEEQKGLQYEDGENRNTAAVDVTKGVTSWAEDIVPFTDIPIAAEVFLKIEIPNHPLVDALGGTIDYLGKGHVSDIKSSKRKASTPNYTTQQSIYKLLAMRNGYHVEFNTIQNVVFTAKETKGYILPLEADVEQAKASVNILLDTLDVLHKDIIHPEILFRGNPKYYLCSEKYCAFYNNCPFVKGTAKESTKPIKVERSVVEL